MKVSCTAEAFTQRRSQAGFTLVEIAIVLVIIGLLLGGILKGQEMINQAKIKNLINDVNGVTAAVQSYQDRYRALPGDDATATSRWGSAVVSGNGNGQIAGEYRTVPAATPTNAQETNLFWWHLRLAGFVAGPTAAGAAAGTPPPNAANGLVGVQTQGLGFPSNIICSSNIPDKLAVSVDVQMDDGTAGTGQVRALLQTAANPEITSATAATENYAETGSNQYVICKSL
jgi:prepilin-type N-terminal cleavage/methylation domain-containing protein